MVRQKSRQLVGNYKQASSSKVKRFKRWLLGPGLTKRRKCEVGLKPEFVQKQPAEVLLSRAPALDELRTGSLMFKSRNGSG